MDPEPLAINAVLRARSAAAETKKFGESIAHLMSCPNELPANATNEQLQNALRTAIAAFVLQGNIFSKILTGQATNLNQLSRMLSALGGRLDQIQLALNQLLAWARDQQRDDGNSADWWKN